MLFLARHLDPGLLKGFGRLEEEVPQLYKRLRYPFQISKSTLTAVGSPHTWPTILAALTWAVELLNYSARAEAVRRGAGGSGGGGGDDRARAEADFFAYVAASYRHFMAGDDAACEAVDAAKGAEFEARAAGVRGATERLRASNDALRAQIEALRVAPSALGAARARRAEALADREKFRKLMDNLAAHRASLQRKVAERSADVGAQTAELGAAEADNEALRARVAAQTVHPADVARMARDRAAQDAALRALAAQRAAAAAKADAAGAGLEARLDGLEAALAEYHARADRLQLVPASAKRAQGVGFEVRLDRGAASAGELVNVDLKGIVKPALQRVRDAYAARARALAEEALSLAEKGDAAGELLAERAEENGAAEARVRALEARHRAGKEAAEAEVAAAEAAVEGLAAQVGALRGAAAAGVAASEDRLHALGADYEELQR
jgi:kinetochore protein NDC80